MKFEQLQSYALSLAEATQQPHFERSSFRVAGKIFATVAPDQSSINLFVAEEDRERAIAIEPAVYEKLWWGSSVVGLTAKISEAEPALMKELLWLAWQRRAPARLSRDQ